jgi:AraC-like DNA-binding protein
MLLSIKHVIGKSCKDCRSNRLKLAFGDAGVDCIQRSLDEVEVGNVISDEQREVLQRSLDPLGIHILLDRKELLVERMKHLLEFLVEPSEKLKEASIRDFVSRKLFYSYSHLANVFSVTLGMSPERYLIELRIERIKLLLVREWLSLSEIAFRLNYSSVAHLSHQFKQVTGMNPTEWKAQLSAHAPRAVEVHDAETHDSETRTVEVLSGNVKGSQRIQVKIERKRNTSVRLCNTRAHVTA